MTAMFTHTLAPSMPSAQRWLAMETSTDTLSLALGGDDGELWSFSGPGGPKASATLLPAVQQGLAQVGWSLASLSAIVVGRGPGSFTGLRTACAVAQGLAYGSPNDQHPEGLPVLPVDTLLAVAEEARAQCAAQGRAVRWVATVLDARMDEVYVALYEYDGVWHERSPARLCAPQEVVAWALTHAVLDAAAWAQDQWVWAGNVWVPESPYASRLSPLRGWRCHALPTASALLRVAPALLALGQAVRPHDVLPLYVRDKVALTTAEREAGQRLQSPKLSDERTHWPLRWTQMQESDLEAVVELEKRAHSHPWSRQHFVDSLRSGYPAWLLWAQVPGRAESSLLGYWLAMPGVEEAHLLNITVTPEHQRQGWGRFMLDALCVWARQHAANSVWLEVRESNQAARALYGQCGFVPMGVRKAYYPTGRTVREDALVMNRALKVGA